MGCLMTIDELDYDDTVLVKEPQEGKESGKDGRKLL